MTNYDVAFRADASLDIGTGHIMRCLTLAETIRERGGRCCFISRQHVGNLNVQVNEKGFDVIDLPKQENSLLKDTEELTHSSWLGTTWLTDANETINAINEKVEWLVVDHYAIEAKWENLLRKSCRRILVIDDLADRRHDCDVLLDQNLGVVRNIYEGLVPSKCRSFVGPEYALLRPEFTKFRSYSLDRRRDGQIRNLLISLGGVDKENTTAKVLDALRIIPYCQHIRINIVMGLHSPWLDQVMEKAESLPCETQVLVNVQNMAELMANSDLAIGGAGTSTWERCCLGLPAIVIIQAENQRKGAHKLHEAGAAILIKDIYQLPKELNNAICELSDSENLIAMQSACKSITKGEGANMIADSIGWHA